MGDKRIDDRVVHRHPFPVCTPRPASGPSSPGSNKGNGGEGKFIARKKGGRKRRAVAIETIRSAGNRRRRSGSGKKRGEDLNADESSIPPIGSSAFIFPMRRYLARQEREASRETTNPPFAAERKNGDGYRALLRASRWKRRHRSSRNIRGPGSESSRKRSVSGNGANTSEQFVKCTWCTPLSANGEGEIDAAGCFFYGNLYREYLRR